MAARKSNSSASIVAKGSVREKKKDEKGSHTQTNGNVGTTRAMNPTCRRFHG